MDLIRQKQKSPGRKLLLRTLFTHQKVREPSVPRQGRITKNAVGHAVMTVINCLLIILCLLFSVVLALSSMKAGTFSIFGKNWYYYQSDVMSGEVERNEHLMINHDTPSEFQTDDLIAFYETDAKGTRVIQIAKVQQVEGNRCLVQEAEGDPFVLDGSTTVFIGRVTSHSKLLGRIVQQMRTKEGRKIFLGWSVAILLFSCGLTILLHVRRDRRIQLEGGTVSGDGYEEYDEYGEPYDEYEEYEEEYDDDYPEQPAARFDRVQAVKNPLYTPPARRDEPEYDDGYEEDYEEDEIPQAVDEENMNLIASSTESEDEEEVDFDAIFREINRQIKNQ